MFVYNILYNLYLLHFVMFIYQWRSVVYIYKRSRFNKSRVL